ncbi:MAG TPA: hypothetical protein VFC09_03480 [Candidatus Dormibacteraeota bacterium]|nr:hypothetical protein [Candidatus Dormibacteraeota bacterium]
MQRSHSPRYEARIERRRAARPSAQPSAPQLATAVEEPPRDAQQRGAPRRPRWNPAPVLDPLVELYRR